jgi:hypothetical protein
MFVEPDVMVHFVIPATQSPVVLRDLVSAPQLGSEIASEGAATVYVILSFDAVEITNILILSIVIISLYHCS